MDLFQSMKAFVATVNSGTMSAAASKLNITPAMVGQHIAALEARLGTRLLHRTTRRQSLTDFGQTYLEQCKDILERVAIADREAQAQSNEAMGLLRITAPVTFGATLLVAALRQYRERSPNVKVELTLTDQKQDIVEEGIDIAFRIGSVPDGRLIQRVLFPYTMMVCSSPGYLAENGEPHHPNDLNKHQIISFTKTSAKPVRFYNNDKQTVELNLNSMVSINNGYALLNAAISGVGIIIQPEVLVARDLANGNLKHLLPDWQLGSRSVSLVYYRHKNMTPKVRSFIDFAVNKFSHKNG